MRERGIYYSRPGTYCGKWDLLILLTDMSPYIVDKMNSANISIIFGSIFFFELRFLYLLYIFINHLNES